MKKLVIGLVVAVAALALALSSGTVTLGQQAQEGGAGPGSCADGIDNDGDGLIDAADPDCAPNTCSNQFDCFFSGFPNTAIGNATLSLQTVDGVEVLRVDNIGSTLTDGVAQSVPMTTLMETTLITPAGNPPNFSSSAPGATLLTTQIGIVDGEADQLFSSLTISNIGSELLIDGDWSPIGAASYKIEIFDGDALVTSQTGLPTGEMRIPIVDIYIIDCRTPEILTGSIHNPVPVAFTIPGRGDFVGDNYRIIAEDYTRTATAQTRIEMFAANMDSLTIVDEFATALPVGGTAELLGQFESPGDASGSSVRDYTAPIAAAIAAGAVVLAAAGWYANRRWLA